MSVGVRSVLPMSSGLDEGYGAPAAHPLVRLVGACEEALKDASGANAWTMTPRELGDALPRMTRLIAAMTEVQLRELVEADRHSIGNETGFTNTALWWAHETGQTKPAAIGALKLGQWLEQHETTRAAMGAGGVLADQAKVIIHAIDALPVDLIPAETIAEAEAHLVELAADHDAKALRILGRKILEVVAPEIAEDHQRQVLEHEEQHAAASASFTMAPDGHGSMLGRFKIPVLAGEILAKHLNAIAAPRHHDQQVPTGSTTAGAGIGDQSQVARPLRLGQAFVEYLETRAASGMPKAGGMPATIVVTMTMADLLGGNGAATLDSGERISASEARRLACEAGIIPAVLGSPSQVLDLGRKTRFHTEPQRIALALSHGSCAEANCDFPPSMCHAHHSRAWSKGGDTSVENGTLLCTRHHTLAHDARYQMKTMGNGRVLFSKRT
ncbi:MAG: hypothetical protein JWP74_1078 [Marmoricola sp.]|nr:hypothetical protein [Marmoricola sp.]